MTSSIYTGEHVVFLQLPNWAKPRIKPFRCGIKGELSSCPARAQSAETTEGLNRANKFLKITYTSQLNLLTFYKILIAKRNITLKLKKIVTAIFFCAMVVGVKISPMAQLLNGVGCIGISGLGNNCCEKTNSGT